MRYVKHNTLAGRGDELVCFEGYVAFAPGGTTRWPTSGLARQLANGRWTVSRRERSLLHALPVISFDTDEVVPAVVSPHARIEFDGNRYSAPPRLVRQPVTIRASRHELRVLHDGQVVAQHVRCYQRGQLIVLPDHNLAALALRHAVSGLRTGARVRCFGARGSPVPPPPEEPASEDRRPPAPLTESGKTLRSGGAALRRLSGLGAGDVRRCLRRKPLTRGTSATAASHTHSAYSPTARIDGIGIQLEPADPALYDRFCINTDKDSSWHDVMTISRHASIVTWPS